MSKSVWPSGSALATRSAATTPPAPGRLSTNTGCPRVSAMRLDTVRTVRSATPPAPKGTTIRSALVGKVEEPAVPCAQTAGAQTLPLRPSKKRRRLQPRSGKVSPGEFMIQSIQMLRQLGVVTQGVLTLGRIIRSALEYRGFLCCSHTRSGSSNNTLGGMLSQMPQPPCNGAC